MFPLLTLNKPFRKVTTSVLDPISKMLEVQVFSLFFVDKIQTNVAYLYPLNPLSANPQKWSNTFKQFVVCYPTKCLGVFYHFVGLTLKGLKYHDAIIMIPLHYSYFDCNKKIKKIPTTNVNGKIFSPLTYAKIIYLAKKTSRQ